MKRSVTITGMLTMIIAVIEAILGEGTFGRVYRVTLDDGKVAAAKFFKRKQSPERLEQISRLCQLPRPHRCFVGWPWDWGQTSKGQQFVLMDIVPQGYLPLTDYLNGKIPLTLRAILCICYQLSDAFASLHLDGFVFPDLSCNQIFINSDGDVAIVDCDNVNFANDKLPNVGTRAYLTVGLATGAERVSPYTDCYALSVLLFEILIGGHPLSRCLESTLSYVSDTIRDSWYVSHPQFAFSHTHANWPDPTTPEGFMTERWHALPTTLRDYFQTTFSAGLWDARHRTLDTEWREEFATLSDRLLECQHCGEPQLFDAARVGYPCPMCDRSIEFPRFLHIRAHSYRASTAFQVAVSNQMQIYSHHSRPLRRYDFTLAGTVVRGDKSNPSFVGLRNLTSDVWRTESANGTSRRVGPQEVAPLFLGTIIHLSGTEASLV